MLAILLLFLVILGIFFWVADKRKPQFCILMYHHVSPVINTEEKTYYVNAEMFADQINMILKKGYTPISLSQLEKIYTQKTMLSSHAVMITLDDGWEDNYTYAFPILQKMKVPATIFLSTAYIDQAEGVLNRSQIDEMHASGLIEFSSHGVNHKRLRDLTDEEVLDELTQSKSIIEEKLGKPLLTFCYPYGAFDIRIRSLVFKAGYKIDIGTRKGLNNWPWKPSSSLRRTHVLYNESIEDFYNELRKGCKTKLSGSKNATIETPTYLLN